MSEVGRTSLRTGLARTLGGVATVVMLMMAAVPANARGGGAGGGGGAGAGGGHASMGSHARPDRIMGGGGGMRRGNRPPPAQFGASAPPVQFNNPGPSNRDNEGPYFTERGYGDDVWCARHRGAGCRLGARYAQPNGW